MITIEHKGVHLAKARCTFPKKTFWGDRLLGIVGYLQDIRGALSIFLSGIIDDPWDVSKKNHHHRVSKKNQFSSPKPQTLNP